MHILDNFLLLLISMYSCAVIIKGFFSLFFFTFFANLESSYINNSYSCSPLGVMASVKVLLQRSSVDLLLYTACILLIQLYHTDHDHIQSGTDNN